MKQTVLTSWKGNMQFDATVNGHNLKMDAVQEVGGNDAGPRPKELMMAALAGCTGMDVISILKKMKVEVSEFDVKVESELTEEHPKMYTGMHLVYSFKGKNLDKDKLKKAIDLSQDKYCGVSAVYRQVMNLTYEIQISE